jgi:hypothetical protein
VIGLAGRLRMGGGRIQLVGQKITTSSTVTFTGLTGGIGSSPIDGDMVIVSAAYAQAGFSTPSLASGLTSLASLMANDSYDAALVSGYLFVSGGAPTSVSVSLPSNTARIIGVSVFRGVSQASPLFVTQTTATGIDALRANPPSIAAGADFYYYCAAGADRTFDNLAYTGADYGSSDLDNFRSDFNQAPIPAATNYISLIGFGTSETVNNPGAYTDSDNRTTSSWCALSVALRAA